MTRRHQYDPRGGGDHAHHDDAGRRGTGATRERRRDEPHPITITAVQGGTISGGIIASMEDVTAPETAGNVANAGGTFTVPLQAVPKPLAATHRRDRRPTRAAATRAKIVAAVGELLAEGTFHEATVDQVADRARHAVSALPLTA